MSTFICEKCGCIDNSAMGGTFLAVLLGDNNELLCQQCHIGSWHNMFPKNHWTTFGTKEELISLCQENKGNFSNAIKYFGVK